MTVSLPEYCDSCPYIDIVSDTMFADDEPVVIQIQCRNHAICERMAEYMKSQGATTVLKQTITDIRNAPTVEAEPTEEQVKEYCRKRCLVVVSSELFNEMKARWTGATHEEPTRNKH